MKNKTLTACILLLLIFILCLSSWKLWQIQSGYKKGQDTYENLSTLVVTPRPPAYTTSPSNAESTAPIPINDPICPSVDFDELKTINDDIIGWIYLENTTINYPIVKGEDNSYYLKHMFTGEWNNNGCIFMDYRNHPDFSDQNTIIYGHNMQDETMFATLNSYQSQEFYDANPTILLMTPDHNYKLQAFSGYVTNATDDAWRLTFSESEFASWINDIISKSCFQSQITPTATDSIITLSTCSYEFDDARFVLHCILK